MSPPLAFKPALSLVVGLFVAGSLTVRSLAIGSPLTQVQDSAVPPRDSVLPGAPCSSALAGLPEPMLPLPPDLAPAEGPDLQLVELVRLRGLAWFRYIVSLDRPWGWEGWMMDWLHTQVRCMILKFRIYRRSVPFGGIR